jgi:hypothetical protein
MFVWKGPFIENSNWAGFSADDFHRSFENFLTDRFAERLEHDTHQSRSEVGSWDNLHSFLETAKTEIADSGGDPNLVVITGRRHRALYDLFDYRTPVQVGGQNAREIDGVIGVLDGLPVYNTWDDFERSRAYVLDLARSYRYVQTNPNAVTKTYSCR